MKMLMENWKRFVNEGELKGPLIGHASMELKDMLKAVGVEERRANKMVEDFSEFKLSTAPNNFGLAMPHDQRVKFRDEYFNPWVEKWSEEWRRKNQPDFDQSIGGMPITQQVEIR